ncbi:MAG: hypothetical protein SCL6.09 [uncultured Nocardioidaceae bacterium]|uniref:Uncharacterized protein n=1 Tax=uncultured Nocardioidaceae bacterium TaxID=253824 RepID=A0A6J4N5B1_9ACTN|nr:MAG: hypothetical protein SCL6.09 [uncultured Nocardioidaceae bacterium]
MTVPTTVAGVIARLREIDDELEPSDGVAVFNRMYLTVTERIGAMLDGSSGPSPFTDDQTMAELDVRFAALWLHAYDGAAAGHRIPSAWRPLFEARAGGRLPVQYALAGMNAHIEHDLPIAVVRTCQSRGLQPEQLHTDYELINDVLARCEAEIRRGFLDEVGQAVDDRVGPVVHVVSAWSIDKARDLSWVTAETIWALRNTDFLLGRFLSALDSTVGMSSRTLLTPTV